MPTYDGILDFLFSEVVLVFEIFCLFILLDTFLQRRHKGKGVFPAAAVYMAAAQTLSSAVVSSAQIGIFVSLLLLFSATVIFFKGRVTTKLVLVFLYWILFVTVDLGFVFGGLKFINKDIGVLMQDNRYQLIVSAVSKLICFCIVLLIRRAWRARLKKWDIDKEDFVYLMFLPVVSAASIGIIAGGYQEQNTVGSGVILYSLILFACNIFQVIMLERAALRRENAQGYQILMRQNQFSEQLLEARLTAEDSLRAQAHEYKNQINSILALLKPDTIEEARKYILSVGDVFDTNTQTVQTHNPYIDAILNPLVARMYKNGINPTIYVDDFSEFSLVQPIDLSTILGNTVDNAIDACSKNSHKKDVSISLRLNDNTLKYIIANQVEAPIDNAAFKTTSKVDELNHGYGLENVERALSNYKHNSDIFYEDGKVFFFCEVFG